MYIYVFIYVCIYLYLNILKFLTSDKIMYIRDMMMETTEEGSSRNILLKVNV